MWRIAISVAGLLVLGMSLAVSPVGTQATPDLRGRILTVHDVRLVCPRSEGSRFVRARGYYVIYPFFGPGPPATPVNLQTGYLFDHQVHTPIDSSTTPQGIVVRGPQFGQGPLIPGDGWVLITGRWSCTIYQLHLKSWKPWHRARRAPDRPA